MSPDFVTCFDFGSIAMMKTMNFSELHFLLLMPRSFSTHARTVILLPLLELGAVGPGGPPTFSNVLAKPRRPEHLHPDENHHSDASNLRALLSVFDPLLALRVLEGLLSAALVSPTLSLPPD